MIFDDEHQPDASHVDLVRTVAGAVIQLAEVTRLQAFSLPYPAEAQRALDRMVLACLVQGVEELPRSVADLIGWCRSRPLADWPLRLPPDLFGPDDFLVDENSHAPTQLCHEWWIQTRDSAARQFDREVIRTAFRLCQQMSAPTPTRVSVSCLLPRQS